MAYWEYYLLGIILLPGLILASWAEMRVLSAYRTYKTALSSQQITGAEAAKRILEHKNIYDVNIVRGSGHELSDHYNSSTKTLTLSSQVYDGMDIASLGVAAHECGHAVQDAEGYFLLRFRSVVGVVSNICSSLLWPLVIIGLVLNFAYVGGVVGQIFVWSGVGFFGLAVLFSLVTLPVEINASKRALTLLTDTGCIDQMEVKGAKKVLQAAAMTYVASLVVSILNLVRFLLVVLLNSRDE